MYRPNGVLKVQSLALWLSSFSCQNPARASRTEKVVACGIRAAISSIVFMG